MDRRTFIAATAGATAGVIIGGCDSARTSAPIGSVSLDTSTASATSTTSATSATSTTIATSPATSTTVAVPADLDALAATLSGTIARDGDVGYDGLRLLQCTSFDDIRPKAVVTVASADDVARVIAYARAVQEPFSIRSGGHSYGGWSSCPGLVIDLRGIAEIEVSQGATLATIGAGAQLIDIYATLAASGVAFSGGSCPTVGIAGLTLGGGHGLTCRAFGLACDAVRSIEMVTADGVVHQCDETHDSDLFWAARGGGGGSFGVVTRFTIEPHPVPINATTFVLKYSWDNSAAALASWMQWVPTLSDNTTTIARLETTPQLVVAGLHLGTEAETAALLVPLMADSKSHSVTGRSYIEALMLEAGCSHSSIVECHTSDITLGGTQARQTPFAATSMYFAEPLSEQAIAAARGAIEQHAATAGSGGGTMQFDSYGGAISNVAPDATAFVHRNAFCLAQIASYFTAGDAAPHRAWLSQTREALSIFGNGESYQNYADPDLIDWQHAYYGTNFERLQQVKRAHDPDNVFTFAQSIPL